MAGFGVDSEKIIKFFRGEYSEKEEAYIDEIFRDNSKVNELKRLLSGQFDELPEDEPDIKKLDHILYRIHYDINTKAAERKEKTIIKIVKWSLRIAGLIILPLSVYWGIRGYTIFNTGKESWIELKAPAYTRAQFILPDGTAGWLNSNSTIKYNGNFNVDRQVILNGEAFFDVFKDKNRPFVVTANEIDVKVLGTRFNIASYENEENVEVVLEEGKLIFNDKVLNKTYKMDPNDMVIYDKTDKDFSIKKVLPQKYLSWTEGKLVFRNDPIDVIARRLERWYNIEVVINGRVSLDQRLHATFIDESLEQVMYFIKRSLPIDYKIEDGSLNTNDTIDKKKVIISFKTK